jgi:hypothetical protein
VFGETSPLRSGVRESMGVRCLLLLPPLAGVTHPETGWPSRFLVRDVSYWELRPFISCSNSKICSDFCVADLLAIERLALS